VGTDDNLDSKQHVIQAALEIAFADDLSEEEVQSKVDSLVDRERESGFDIDEQEVWDVIDHRLYKGTEPATYSWVHLNKFRKFELHNRCFRGRQRRNSALWLATSRPQHHVRRGSKWGTVNEPALLARLHTHQSESIW